MKSKKTNNKFILLAFVAIIFIVSCKVSGKIKYTLENDNIAIESPKIIFLTYSIVNDTIKQEYRIRLLNKIITEGKIKKNPTMTATPAIDDLEYIVLNKESQVLMRSYISNPLIRTIEYVNNNEQLAKKDIRTDSTLFSLRIQLDKAAQFISIQRYTGQNSENIPELITDIFKIEKR